MDKEKTGRLIASVRKQKNMTQLDLAQHLHVTSKAVSKWERGLSFPGVDMLEPLAEVLGLTVMDILSGEIVENGKLQERSEEISLQVMRREKKTAKRSLWLSIGVAAVLLMLLFFQTWGPAIFQRGNPIPYLLAATKLSEQPFAEVNDDGGGVVFITKLGESDALFEYIQSSRKVTFLEQAGSGYIFTTGTDHLVVSSEIYWGRFTVWSMSDRTLSCG